MCIFRLMVLNSFGGFSTFARDIVEPRSIDTLPGPKFFLLRGGPCFPLCFRFFFFFYHGSFLISEKKCKICKDDTIQTTQTTLVTPTSFYTYWYQTGGQNNCPKFPQKIVMYLDTSRPKIWLPTCDVGKSWGRQGPS